MPIFFGSIVFILLALTATAVAGVMFTPGAPILLIVALVLFMLGCRAGSRTGNDNPPGPQTRSRAEAKEANE